MKAEFGDLKANMESKYVKFDKVHLNLAYVKLFIDGNEFVLQPNDYDAPILDVGDCTYMIKVVDFEKRIISLKTLLEN